MEGLAESISSYVEYLNNKRAQINEIHSSDMPARMISDALSVEYMKPCYSRPPELDDISTALGNTDLHSALDIDDILPCDHY